VWIKAVSAAWLITAPLAAQRGVMVMRAGAWHLAQRRTALFNYGIKLDQAKIRLPLYNTYVEELF